MNGSTSFGGGAGIARGTSAAASSSTKEWEFEEGTLDAAGSVPGMAEVCKVVKGGHSQTVDEIFSSGGKEAMGVELGVGLNPKEPGMIPMA